MWGRPVISVFIGGGTPSLFSPDSIERLVADIRARLPLVPGCEITLEANPGTFERERFRAFRAAGVTRLSIGVQSFHDDSLRAIGRVHDAAQARAAVEEAAQAFDTFNIDLMYALPGQTLALLQADLDTALAFAPPHLSVYHLTLEPNTWFATHPPPLPDEDLAAQMLDLIVERSAAAGLQRYEVSAFAREGHRCQHNLNYWHFGDYLGIGAGAHGKLSFPHRVLRQQRWREPARYMEQALGRPGAVAGRRSGARRAALRVHAQCAAPARRRAATRCSANAPACRHRPSTPACARRSSAGCCTTTCSGCSPPSAASTFCRTCRRCFWRANSPVIRPHLRRFFTQGRC